MGVGRTNGLTCQLLDPARVELPLRCRTTGAIREISLRIRLGASCT